MNPYNVMLKTYNQKQVVEKCLPTSPNHLRYSCFQIALSTAQGYIEEVGIQQRQQHLEWPYNGRKKKKTYWNTPLGISKKIQ